MKLNVKYVGMTMGAHYRHGETVMDLPDTNFVDQYKSFCEKMTEIASENQFFELDQEGMEIIDERDTAPSISFDEMIHPDADAIARRDEFLRDRNDVHGIRFINGEVHAEADI